MEKKKHVILNVEIFAPGTLDFQRDQTRARSSINKLTVRACGRRDRGDTGFECVMSLGAGSGGNKASRGCCEAAVKEETLWSE